MSTATQHHPMQAVVKAKQGKGSARDMRNKGYVPAIIYGHEKDAPITLGVFHKDLEKALRVGHFYTHMQEVVLDGKAV